MDLIDSDGENATGFSDVSEDIKENEYANLFMLLYNANF